MDLICYDFITPWLNVVNSGGRTLARSCSFAAQDSQTLDYDHIAVTRGGALALDSCTFERQPLDCTGPDCTDLRYVSGEPFRGVLLRTRSLQFRK